MANLRNFFITFCVCLTLFSLAAANVMKYFTTEAENGGDDVTVPVISDSELSDDIIEFGDGKNVGEDIVGESFSVLLSIFDNDKKNIKYMGIIKADKEMKHYLFLSIPMNMVVTVDNTDTALSDVMKYHDKQFLYDKVYAVTGLKTDYFAEMTESGLSELVDTLGGIAYDIPKDMLQYGENNRNIPSVDLKKGRQKLGGNKVLQLLRYNGYINDKTVECSKAQTGVMKAIMNLIATDKHDYVISNSGIIFGLMTTNLPKTFFSDNTGMITGYTSFIKTESQYPGYETVTDEEIIFTPYVDEATVKFRQYR